MLSDLTPITIFYIVITLIVSLSIHEAMHAFVGYKLGDNTAHDMGRLSINPLKHIDPLTTVLLPIVTLVLFHAPILAAKPVPYNASRVKFNEFGGALIAVAGPLSNLVLAIIAAFIVDHVQLASVLNNFLSIFAIVNVGIFVFNIIPIPPLDGSRVLYALAPEPVQDFMQQIEPYGLIIVFALVLTGVLANFLINVDNSILRLIT